MSKMNERRARVKFRSELGENATKTYATITIALGDDPLSRFEWAKRFEDGLRSGRPSILRNDDVVAAAIFENVRNDPPINRSSVTVFGSCCEI